MVSYVDGSVLAQLGNPDMRTPIAHSLAWPERVQSGVAPLDMFAVGRLDFEKPDYLRFPCLKLAYDALRVAGTAPAVLNAANEVAVEMFLDNRLAYNDIPRTIEYALEKIDSVNVDSLETVMDADRRARDCANQFVSRA